MTLYQYNSAIANFNFAIDEATGEITNGEEYDRLNQERNEKVENTALLIKDKVAFLKAIEDEEKQLAAKKQTLKNEIQWLKDYLGMILGQYETFKTARVTISHRNTEAVEYEDEQKLAMWLRRHKKSDLTSVKYKVNSKADIKALIKSGVKVPFAKIVENNNIQIK